MGELKQQIIKVGIADLKVVKAPDTIRTAGLGSCVGLVVYDQVSKRAGLLHIMLPNSILSRSDTVNVAKFADTGVKALIEQMGVSTTRLKAKMAGGAQMFQFASQKDTMRIGPRNVEAIKDQLKLHRIPLLGEDVGGNSGRTIEFDPATSLLHVRTVNAGETML